MVVVLVWLEMKRLKKDWNSLGFALKFWISYPFYMYKQCYVKTYPNASLTRLQVTVKWNLEIVHGVIALRFFHFCIPLAILGPRVLERSVKFKKPKSKARDWRNQNLIIFSCSSDHLLLHIPLCKKADPAISAVFLTLTT